MTQEAKVLYSVTIRKMDNGTWESEIHADDRGMITPNLLADGLCAHLHHCAVVLNCREEFVMERLAKMVSGGAKIYPAFEGLDPEEQTEKGKTSG